MAKAKAPVPKKNETTNTHAMPAATTSPERMISGGTSRIIQMQGNNEEAFRMRAEAMKQLRAVKGIGKLVGSVNTSAAVRSRGWARTGLPPLDFICGLGRGVPMGVVMELVGKPASGKSTAALYMAAKMQRLYGAHVYIADIEQDMDDSVFARAGLDVSEDALGIMPEEVPGVYYYSAGYTFSTLAKFTAEFYEKTNGNVPLVVVLDSLAKLNAVGLEEAIEAGSGSGKRIAEVTYAVQNGMNMYKGFVAGHSTIFIVCNQVRADLASSKLGGFGGPALKSWGGWAWDHEVNVRLRIDKSNMYEGFYKRASEFSDKSATSAPDITMMKVECTKSKVSRSRLKTGIVNVMGTGVDAIRSTILHAAFNLKGVFDSGLIAKGGRDAAVKWKGEEYTTKKMTEMFIDSPLELQEFLDTVDAAHAGILEDTTRMMPQLLVAEDEDGVETVDDEEIQEEGAVE